MRKGCATDRGPLLAKAGGLDMPAEAIEFSKEAELYFLHKEVTDNDPRFMMFTDDSVVIEFGITGLVRNISKISGKRKKTLETIVSRDRQGRFLLERELLPADSVVDRKDMDNAQLISQLIDYAYQKSRTLPDDRESKLGRLFHHQTANAVISRFMDFATLMGTKDIIPDYNDTMVFVKVSDGCGFSCDFCPEAGKLILYSKKQIWDEMRYVRSIQKKHHGKALELMDEGFINGSDLLWYAVMKSAKASPESIVKMLHQAFPEVEKIGAFLSIRNILRVCNIGNPEDPYDSGSASPENYSADYLKRLCDAGLSRAYIGIETGSTQGSALFSKNETYEMKRTALHLLKEAKIGVKAIIQAGLFGKGFYGSSGEFVASQEAADDTIRLLLETRPYRIMISRNLDLPGTPYHRLVEQGRIVPYDDKKEIEAEIAYLESGLKKRSHEARWQGQRNDNFVPLEPGYEGFVKGKKRR